MAAPDSFIPNAYSDLAPGAGDWRKFVSKELFCFSMGIVERVADLIVCASGILLACGIAIGPHISHGAWEATPRTVAISLFTGILAVILLQANGAYSATGSLLRIRETEHAIRIPVQLFVLLLPICFIAGQSIPIVSLAWAYPLITILLILEKQLWIWILSMLHSKGFGVDRVVIYGEGEVTRRITSSLLSSRRLGFQPVAIISEYQGTGEEATAKSGYKRRHLVPLERGPLTPALLKSHNARILIVAIANLSSHGVARILSVARQAGVRVAFLSNGAIDTEPWTVALDLDGLLFASAAQPPESPLYTVGKRAADLVLASIFLVVLAPLLVAIALLIRLDSPGPALFIQKRVGARGMLFRMLKFRSMHVETPIYQVSPFTAMDDRITRIGRILRKTSLDELPQLFNVILGEMSLVGPRPEMPFIVKTYSPTQQRRLDAVPGITGLWQLSADRPEPIHDNIHYDLFYIKNRTFCMDVAILLHTIIFAMRGI